MQTLTIPVAPAPDPPPGTRPDYKSFLSKFFGGAQITLGVASCIVQIVAYAVHASLAPVSHGIWCGIFFIVAGILGIVAGNTKRTKHIVACLVLSILAASIFAVTLMVLAAIGLKNDSGCFYGSLYQGCVKKNAVNRALVSLAGFEIITAIFSAVNCCRPFCCPATRNVRVYTQGPVQYNTSIGHQAVYITTPSAGQTYYVLPGGSAPPQHVMQSAAYTVQPGLQGLNQTTGFAKSVVYYPGATNSQVQAGAAYNTQPPGGQPPPYPEMTK